MRQESYSCQFRAAILSNRIGISVIVGDSATDRTSEEQEAAERSRCESVQSQLANTIHVFKIQIPSYRKIDSSCRRIQIQSHCLRLQSCLLLRSKSKIRIQNPDRHCQNRSAHHFVAAVVRVSWKKQAKACR